MIKNIESSAPTISVVMCAHNPRDVYIAQALVALRAQILPMSSWEFLIVDNRSEPSLDTRLDVSWHPQGRIVREETLGLTPARLRGIAESKGELLVFVDDDNVLEPDYLEKALCIAADYPFLGSWSGQCVGEFDAQPPDWTRRYWGSLCIRTFNKSVWSSLPRLAETMPAGAGLCIRRKVGEEYVDLHRKGERSFQFDRTGSSLISGGDNDLAACACRVGLGVGLFPELILKHLIPQQRLSSDYLARLAEGIAFSSTLLDALWGAEPQLRSRSGRFVDFLRVLRLSGPDRAILRAHFRGRDAATRIALIQKDHKDPTG